MTPNIRQDDDRVGAVQDVLRKPGTPLEPAVRALMEARFGRDFSRVRLHTDDQAADSARALDAQAYAVGSHIAFAEGQYNPGAQEGLWLLAHELAHIVQQGGEGSMTPLGVSDAGDPLERVADRAGDLIAAGHTLPAGFAFGVAPASLIQCHEVGPGTGPCPGTRIDIVTEDMVREANLSIEEAFRLDQFNRERLNTIFFGSNWQNNFRVPPNAPNQSFATELLNTLRGWPARERPNVIDFDSHYRAAFFFRRDLGGTRPPPTPEITRFHALAHSIGRRHNEPAWNSNESLWFPPHVLPFADDPSTIVCTRPTAHEPVTRGLILYDIRALQSRRRAQRRATEVELVDFEPAQGEFAPMVRAQLPEAIRFYDPANSNYVVIAPQEFYTLDYVKYKAGKAWQKLQPKMPYFLDPRNPKVGKYKASFMILTVLLGAYVATVPILLAAPAAVGTGAVVTATTVTVETGVAGTTIASTIVVPAEIAAQLAGTGTAVVGSGTVAGAGGISVAAFQTLMTAPAVKVVAATAGAVLVLGNVKNAQAAKPSVDHVTALRAAAVSAFRPVGGVQSASSTPDPNAFQTPEEARGKFGLGTRVLYDGKPHWILGQFSVS